MRLFIWLLSSYIYHTYASNGLQMIPLEEYDDDMYEEEISWTFEEEYSYEHIIWGERTDEMYGSSVAIWDDLMIVGARGDESRGIRTGAAYVYYKHGDDYVDWALGYVLHPEDGAEDDEFGYSVALHSHVAVVGAINNDAMGQDSGAAYLYERHAEHHDEHNHEHHHDEFKLTKLEYVMKLVPEDGSGQDYFGCSVGASGNTTVVGAWGCDEIGTLAGCVYVWMRIFVDDKTGVWTYKQKITPSDGAAFQRFGSSVAIYDGLVVAGAPGTTSDEGMEIGAAYIFNIAYDDTQYDGYSWKQEAKLIPEDGAHYDLYGQAVAIWEDSVLVGSPQHSSESKKYGVISQSGAAYSYAKSYNTWYLVEEIYPKYPSEEGHFGYSLDVYENLASIGAYNEGGSGAVYIYREYEKSVKGESNYYWSYHTYKQPEDEIPGDMFGYSVSIFEQSIAVGAYGASLAWEDPEHSDKHHELYHNGGVYIYTAGVKEETDKESVKEFEINIAVTAGILVITAVSSMAILYMCLDVSGKLSSYREGTEYQLTNLDTSHGMRPGSAYGRDATSNPLYPQPSRTPTPYIGSMDSSTNSVATVSLHSVESFGTYGPSQQALDESVRKGTSRQSISSSTQQ